MNTGCIADMTFSGRIAEDTWSRISSDQASDWAILPQVCHGEQDCSPLRNAWSDFLSGLMRTIHTMLCIAGEPTFH